jgi:hypothetical protein
MSLVRSGSAGATRVCPHCKATVLESAPVCPGCRHHLRFSSSGQALEPGESYCALSVDGTIVHTRANEPCEYCVVLDVHDERGEQLTRQVVGVGVLQHGERRRLNLSVEMLPVRAPVAARPPAPAKGVATAVPAPPGAAPGAAPTPAAAPARSAAAPAPDTGHSTTGPQQPAKPIASSAAAASMQRLGIIRKPR